MVNTLTMFYGSQQSSIFEVRKNIASSLIDSITKEVMQNFWGEQVLAKHLQEQCKEHCIKNEVFH